MNDEGRINSYSKRNMNKIKVCHFTSVHPLDDIRIFHKECISLANNGYEVTIIACGEKGYEEIKNGEKCISLYIPVKNRLQRFLKRSKAIFRKAIEIDADIYHFHDPELLLIGLKLKHKGKKVIFDSHEDVPNDIKNKRYLNPLFRYIFYFLYLTLEPLVIRQFDAVISVTPHIINKLKKYNTNTVQITNYPITNAEDDITQSKISKFSIPTIFFAGGINSLWMHENIIKSLEKIDLNLKYLIAGYSSNEYLNKLKQLNGWHKVEYLGVISYSQVEYFYLRSHIGIALPNYTKAGGGKIGTIGNTKIFEIMKAGLPIICTDFILWEKIIDENKCGICVNPNNIDAISKAIIKLITNQQESQIMGNNGKKAVLNRYNWKSQEKVLINLYKNI
mgnify:CR=1 FL=1